ncbi:MAG: SCO family protein [Geodermatophilaceae bacterium]
MHRRRSTAPCSTTRAGRPDLTLLDTAGRPFSLADRPDDEVTVIFFGYTHCPDVCPTTMADLAVAGRQLPPEVREQVTVAFITEDPQRDTPEALRAWLDQFDSSFLGLLGGNEATQAALAELLLPETTRLRTRMGSSSTLAARVARTMAMT